ncbi:hypothetical protein FHS91_003690 [Sphingobium xanthum]|jgi:hypothetical protein
MSMTLKFVVMGIAAMLAFSFIWLRTRSERSPSVRPAGSGLSDEMAAAFDDVSSEFLQSERARDHPQADKPGEAKRPGKQ